jgi:hypothetical protein
MTTLFKCQCCGIVYSTNSNIDGPEVCGECLKTIYNYELKTEEERKCLKNQDSK